MSTIEHPAIVGLLATHGPDILQDWVEEDLVSEPFSSLARDRAEGHPVLAEMGRRLLRLYAGAPATDLTEWLDKGELADYPDEAILEAVLRMNRRIRREVDRAAAAHPQRLAGAGDAVGTNSDAIVRAVVSFQLRRLRAAQSRGTPGFHELAGVLKDTLYSIMPDGTVRYVSQGVEQVTGISHEVFIQNPKAWRNIVEAEDRTIQQELLRKVLETKKVAEEVYRIRHRQTGHVGHVLDRMTPVVVDGTVVRIDGILVDITERRELEARLERSVHLRSLGQLAGGIAHDFNNLLVSILGYADLLLVRARPGSKEANALDLITAAAERGAELTERLLTFARGSTSTQKQPTRLEKVLRDTLALVTPSVPRSIRLELHEEPDVPVVIADAPQIGEAILNLVLNAVQAVERGGGDLVRVVIRGSFPDETAQMGTDGGCTIVVVDNGPGMSQEVLQHVFEPLFTTRGDKGGTGLGCAMAYGVALDHGGLLTVDSAPTQGAEFRFMIPAAPPDAKPVRRGRKVMPTPVARVKGADHVLVADDEPSVRQLLTDVLEGSGYRVTAVDNGDEAVALVQRDPDAYDLVILDVMMSPGDGTEAFTKIRQIAPKLPAVFCTGYSDTARVAMPQVLQGATIVSKPFRPVKLVETVRAKLRRRRKIR